MTNIRRKKIVNLLKVLLIDMYSVSIFKYETHTNRNSRIRIPEQKFVFLMVFDLWHVAKEKKSRCIKRKILNDKKNIYV